MTKSSILSQISQTELALRALKLSEFPRNNISSPFTDDKKPSFKLYKNGTYKCFSTGKQGDAFQLIADLQGLDCKTQFSKILEHIKEQILPINTTHPPANHPPHTTTPIQVKHKPFEQTHFQFWSQYSVDKSILQRYNVQAVDSFTYTKQNGENKTIKLFGGTFGFDYILNERSEIYIPAQPTFSKFYLSKQTNADIFGLQQLPQKSDFIIITAGKKDCLILNALGFTAVSFKSETINPTKTQIQLLKTKCTNLYLCYDNDTQGQTQAKKICTAHHITPIHLPNQHNDIADFAVADKKSLCAFLLETLNIKSITTPNNQSTTYPIPETITEQGNTIFHIVESYLTQHYHIRRNTVKLDIEIRPKQILQSNNPTNHGQKQQQWQSLNENTLFVELQKKGINISIERLVSILKSDYTPQYNPFTDYFNNLPKWDGTHDYIQHLALHVQAENQPQFNHHFKKWLVRAVKCATIPEYFNKQAFVLVHNSQNSGKSTFCRFLCPPTLSQYIAEDISNDKDARILLCKNLLINLDELAVLSRQEINSLKSYFSKTQINERLPYDRKNSIIPRTCSFIGSTNMDEFLNDETGSVRWLCFRIKAINWAYKTDVNIDKVWAQALAHANDTNYEAELTRQEIQENEHRNRDFEIITNERALIHKYIAKPTAENEGEFCTATEILIHLQNWSNLTKLSTVGIGRALAQAGYPRIRHNNIYGYQVIKITNNQ